MPRARLAALLLAALAAPFAPLPAAAARRAPPASRLRLDGEPLRVRWTDGDSFQVLGRRGPAARLLGVNALEAYGPVHRWGRWTPAGLLGVARAATAAVAAREWECTSAGERDAYGRALVSCPGAAAMLVERGLAMAYAIGGQSDPELLRLQREAQARGAGMWAEGVPRALVSSLHSRGEPRGGETYDRLVDTATGEARKVGHANRYRTCQEVCTAPPDPSCMVYVPFERRYRGKPRCLRVR
jgi:endonuclease YncB( thermonuclease family)